MMWLLITVIYLKKYENVLYFTVLYLQGQKKSNKKNDKRAVEEHKSV